MAMMSIQIKQGALRAKPSFFGKIVAKVIRQNGQHLGSAIAIDSCPLERFQHIVRRGQLSAKDSIPFTNHRYVETGPNLPVALPLAIAPFGESYK